jgi:hypothetical protein
MSFIPLYNRASIDRSIANIALQTVQLFRHGRLLTFRLLIPRFKVQG